jgi:protease-4
MSDVAGSGGYYIAAGATKIFAHPDTLTGSIGVVSGKLAPGPALAKVGVRAFPLGRGRLATMAVSLSPWTAAERAVVVDAMDTVYREFVGRVAAGRGKTPAAVEPIAQGRIWTGAKAQQLGLVDELGGLDAAVAEARRLGGVPAATELEVYPPPPTLRDVIQGMSGVAELPLASAADAAVAAIATADGALGAAARRLVELALSFRHTRVQTVTAIPAIR